MPSFRRGVQPAVLAARLKKIVCSHREVQLSSEGLMHPAGSGVHSDGSAVRAYCYLADATVALLRILLDGEAAQAYNMGNDDAACSVLELAETLTGLFPEKKLMVKRVETKAPTGYLQSHVAKTIPDTRRLRSLGWEPRISLQDGLAQTYEWAERTGALN